MPDVTWGMTDSGSVLDTRGNTVGTADGAGTFTIGTNVEVGELTGSANLTLTIETGVTVKMGTSNKFILRAYPTNSIYGTLDATGVTFTSSAGSPAAGDWAGFTFASNTAAGSPAILQHLLLTDCIVEYASVCILSQSGANEVAHKVVATGCTFRQFTSAPISHQGGYGYDSVGAISYPSWDFFNCQFYTESGNITGASDIIQASSGTTDADKRVMIQLDHCSFYIPVNSAFDVNILKVANYSAISFTNCIAEGANAGAGDVGLAWISGTSPALLNGNNFHDTDVLSNTGSTYTYSPATSEQNVDPVYLDDATHPFDLSPDAQAGTPDLYLSDEFGGYPGAVEPYNYPTVDEPDPTGTTGVWAGRKQRVYETFETLSEHVVMTL